MSAGFHDNLTESDPSGVIVGSCGMNRGFTAEQNKCENCY